MSSCRTTRSSYWPSVPPGQHEDLFSFDLGRGTPRLKPKIIRGAKDYWTKTDEVDIAYKSELSNFLGHFIKAYSDKTSFPCLTKEKYGNTLLYPRIRSTLI